MSTGTVRQFPIYADDETGYGLPAAVEPIVDGEGINGTVLSRPAQNLRLRTEKVRGVLEDLLYLADADRVLMLAGPGTVTWPGSTTAGGTGIFTISDALFLLPALTPGSAQTSPIPPVGSEFGSLALTRASDSMPSIGVTSLLRGYHGGDKINVTVVAGAVYSCVLADETTMSIVITVTGATQLSTVITSLDALLNGNGDNICDAGLINGAVGTDIIESPQAQQFMELGYDAEGHTLTPAQLATFFGVAGNELAEGDSLCVQYSTMIDETPATDGGRRQSLPENSNTAVTSGMLFNSRVNPDRLPNSLPVCKVINGRLVFIGGQQVPAGAVGFDLGTGHTSIAVADVMRNVVVSGFDEGTHVALSFEVDAGVYWLNGTRLSKALDSVALANNATNYVYIDTDGDLKATATSSTAVALTRLVLYQVVTAGGAITTVTDLRRYLTKYNSRRFVTVGGTNCDFATLESAYAWTGLMGAAGEDTYFEIVIQGDVSMAGTMVIDHAITISQNIAGNGHINTPSGAFAFTIATGTVAKVIFKNVQFNVPTAAGSGLLEVSGTAVCDDWEFDNCTIVGGRDEHIIDVRSGPHKGWRIANCKFSGMAHTALSACVLLQQMTGAVIEKNRILGGLGDLFDAGILVMYGSDNNVIQDNHITTGGLGIAVVDDDITVTLTEPSQGNLITKNTIIGTEETAIEVGAYNTVNDNYLGDCMLSGGGSQGAIHVFGRDVIISKNTIRNWGAGNAIVLNASGHGARITDNMIATTGAGAGVPVYSTGTLIGVTVSGNYMDVEVGAGAGAGVAAGAAIYLLTCTNCVIVGNTILNVGTTGSPSLGIILVGANSTVANNNAINCRGAGIAAGVDSVIAANVANHADCDMDQLQISGKVVFNGHQRSESLATITTDTIVLDESTSTLYVQCPGGTTHTIGGLSGGTKGRRVEIWNTGTTTISIGHEEGTETDVDRIHCSGTADITLPAKGLAIATYDENINRWRAAIAG